MAPEGRGKRERPARLTCAILGSVNDADARRDERVHSDEALLADVDAAMARARELAGPRWVCGPGRTECCHGPFPINALDAHRLRRGPCSPEEIEGLRVTPDPRNLEDALLSELEDQHGEHGETLIAVRAPTLRAARDSMRLGDAPKVLAWSSTDVKSTGASAEPVIEVAVVLPVH
jgi:hypothetical protein